MSHIAVFDPHVLPCKGMNASMHPTSLDAGIWAQIQNWRIGNGVLTVRDPQVNIPVSGLPDGWTVSGKVLFVMQSGVSTPVLMLAVDTSTKVQVYYSTNFNRTDGGTATFTQLTASSGKWGDTQFDTGAKEVSFSVVKSPTRYGVAPFNTNSAADTDFVLCSDGKKTITGPLASGDARSVKEAWRTNNFAVIRQEAMFPVYFTMTDAGINTSHNGVNMSNSDTGTVPTSGGIAPKITFLTTASSTSDYGIVTKASGSATLAQGAQFTLVYYCSDPDVWNKVGLDFFDGSTVYQIWKPGNSQYKKVINPVDGDDGVKMVTFQIDSSVIPQNTAVTAFRLVWNGTTSPSSNIDIYLIGAMGGGTMGGGDAFAVEYHHSGSNTSSEAIVCDNQRGAVLSTMGVGDSAHHYALPVYPNVKYCYNIFWEAPPSSATDKQATGDGLDYVLFYCQKYGAPDDSPFWLVASTPCASYSGSWSATYTAGSTVVSTVTGPVLYQRSATKEFHRPIPPHTCAVSANNRLFVGNTKFASTISGSAVTNNSGYMWSVLGDCFSFSDNFNLLTDQGLDPTAAGRSELNGQRPQAVVVASSARSTYSVTDPLVIVTDKGCYTADTRNIASLLSPTLEGPYGTLCPGSVCIGHGAVFYFDTNRQIRRLSQVMDSPSRWRMDALWRGIPANSATGMSTRQSKPRDNKVTCEYWDDKLYVFYTPSGYFENLACSVYDTTLDIWYDDALGVNVERAFIAPIPDDRDQLRFVTVGDHNSTGGYTIGPKLYQHEQPGSEVTDDGTGIVTSLQSWHIHDADWQGHDWNSVGIISDVMNNNFTEFTVTRAFLPSSETSVGKIFVGGTGTVTGTRAYNARWDTVTVNGEYKKQGGFDASVQISLSATLNPGFKIYNIVIDKAEGGSDIRDVNGGKNGY